ncbi:MAG: hypothetical protein SWX82_29865 [Cyanobacteriota bacterium]|nr:hypothetical protein [Cyanobacteriota bacterium]
MVKIKNNMSAYQDRLTKTEIETVSAYVLEEAKNGWHSEGAIVQQLTINN